MEKRDQKSHVYKYNLETEGHRFDLVAVKFVVTEKLEYSRRYMEGVHKKMTKNANNRAVKIPACHIGQRS